MSKRRIKGRKVRRFRGMVGSLTPLQQEVSALRAFDLLARRHGLRFVQ